MVWKMEKERYFTIVAKFIKESSKIMRNRGLGMNFIQMDLNTKGIIKVVKEMVKVGFNGRTESSTMGNGKIT